MGSLQDDIPKGQPAPTDFQEEANIYEDEINLIDYFGVPWKRKYLAPLGLVLPASIVGPLLFFWPIKYKVAYIYDIGLTTFTAFFQKASRKWG